jgi:V/A-type H+-transporting ATPase subunit I
MGEDLVYVYDTPSATDKDPSPWVIWFFALFFGMIISDAAYGFLFLSAAVFCWVRFGKTLKGAKRRALKIFTLISCSTILWGVMVASYFSVKMKPNDFLNTISLPYNLALEKVKYHQKGSTELYKEWVIEYPAIENVDAPAQILLKGTKNKGKEKIFELMNETYDSIFLEISLIVGIVHLTLSLMRNLRRNWGGIGWIATLFGGYLFFQKVLNGTSMVVYTGLIDRDLSIMIGEQLLYGGLFLAVLCGILQARGLSGITAIFKAIEIFSDVLSYLRLYALGLASVVLAGTFNEIGPAIGGPMFGWIIVLLGHIVNIGLGVMAGVIHGLRLNFLEWYHHSYEGGGKKFSPLRLLKNE